ncbi:hypothetical protein Pfo_031141 [Paulownia fortunei]|nr:hypothetical protein Pfo_031141 [Paulownia fortunei]
MESSSSRQKSSPTRKTNNTRRSWTVKEEQVLICALKDIIVRGCLSTMLSRSDFGWNDASHTLDVQSDEIDSNAHTMRYKAWPFYKDWCDTFGKDRATEESAEAFVDIFKTCSISQKRVEADKGGENVPFFYCFNEEADYTSINCGKSSANQKSKSSKKRKEPDVTDNRFIDLMTSFCDKTEVRLGDLAERIKFEHDASASRKVIFEALVIWIFSIRRDVDDILLNMVMDIW